MGLAAAWVIVGCSPGPAASHAGTTWPTFQSRREIRAHVRSLRAQRRAVDPPSPDGSWHDVDPRFTPLDRGVAIDAATLGDPGQPHSDVAGQVRLHGRHLVILRCGSLFVLDTEADLRLVTHVDLELDLHLQGESWLMLAGSRVVVVSTRLPSLRLHRAPSNMIFAVRTFELDGAGGLRDVSAFDVRGGGFFGPFGDHTMRAQAGGFSILRGFELDDRSPATLHLPAIRRRDAGRTGSWRPLLQPRDVVRPLVDGSTLYFELRCLTSEQGERCVAHGVMSSGAARTMTDDHATYLWAPQSWPADSTAQPASVIHRLPRAAEPMTAVALDARPHYFFPWRHDTDGSIDLVVDRATPRAAMSVVDVPTHALAAGYVTLPDAMRDIDDGPAHEHLQTRVVGQHLFFAAPDCDDGQTLVVKPLAGGAPLRIAVPHCIDRIDPLADGALLVGVADGGALTYVRASDPPALFAVTLPKATSTLSVATRGPFHDPAHRVLALELWEGLPGQIGPTDLRFFHYGPSGVSPIDTQVIARRTLVANPEGECAATLDAVRPVFHGDRVFALLGHELVEYDSTPFRPAP